MAFFYGTPDDSNPVGSFYSVKSVREPAYRYAVQHDIRDQKVYAPFNILGAFFILSFYDNLSVACGHKGQRDLDLDIAVIFSRVNQDSSPRFCLRNGFF